MSHRWLSVALALRMTASGRVRRDRSRWLAGSAVCSSAAAVPETDQANLAADRRLPGQRREIPVSKCGGVCPQIWSCTFGARAKQAPRQPCKSCSIWLVAVG
eukprot:1577313-Pleurochrysis_carterae.AAC.3